MVDKYKIGDSKVLESRESSDGKLIRRRRETLDGKYRFTTYEKIERPPLVVVKKNGTKELFDRAKLSRSTKKSVGKFFESELEIEAILDKVEEYLYDLGEQEVMANIIGEQVLSELLEVNEVAYVRFASVFRKFKSLKEFEQILSERKKGKQ
ncbi:transcriptional regulator NrdR [Candidatus Saccharibacteria bacterium]|nr:transcriptional regulator NrdR [Candidatus Saccharibacteria bacterium]